MIRKAELRDIPALGRLLYEVHKVHSDVRPDLFKAGARKYTDGQLEEILQSGERPVFVAEQDGQVAGYAFCIPKQFVGDRSMTDVRTLYIDDLCVDEARGGSTSERSSMASCSTLQSVRAITMSRSTCGRTTKLP